MPRFNANDPAVVVYDGREVAVTVKGDCGPDYWVQQDAGQPFRATNGDLLRPKGPFFEVRGLVFTTSTIHPGDEGEIVALGNGPKGQRFYRVKFADGATEWFNENNVLIEDKEESTMDILAKLGEQ